MTDKQMLPLRPQPSEPVVRPLAKIAPQAAPTLADIDEAHSERALRRLMVAGLATIIVSFGGFFTWAVSTELSSATVANGSVIVDSKRKTISHFEGGVMGRLLVQEGEQVAVGQPLILLEDTRARSNLNALTSRRIGLIARLARLKAEQDGAAAIAFPKNFGEAGEIAVDEAIKAENVLFDKRHEAKAGRVDVQTKTIEEYGEQTKSLLIQLEATDRQIALITEQRTAIATLVEKGFVQRAKLIEVDTRLSELARARGELAGDKAQAEKARAGAQLALIGIESEFQSTIAGEITTARIDLTDVEEQIVAAKDVLRRMEIRSPQAGVVSNIWLRTPGSAVTPGQPLMEIVPEDEPLVVEMRVNPRDIDSISVGSPTQIRLTAYNQRSRMPFNGAVTYIAADQTVDEKSGASYFTARAKIDAASLAADPDVRLYPGAPAEVLIVHKARRAIDYLVSPLTESFNRAFRED